MTTRAPDDLERALTAVATLGTPGKIATGLRVGGVAALDREFQRLSESVRVEVERKAEEMRRDETGTVIFRSEDFPKVLVKNDKPIAPTLFYRGNKDLLHMDGSACAAPVT